MANKAMHEQKHHHVGIWTAECTRFDKWYKRMTCEVRTKFIFSLRDYASLGK
jgi:hypothetical protein